MISKLFTKLRKMREMKKWKGKITRNFKDLEHRKKLTKAQKKRGSGLLYEYDWQESAALLPRILLFPYRSFHQGICTE